MGGVFTVQSTYEQIAIQASQCLCAEYSYIHNLSGNLASLEDVIETLKAKRDDVQRQLIKEEFTGRQRRTFEVQRWLGKASSIEEKYNVLLSSNMSELQRLCLCGFCSKNLKQSYCYGKSVVMLLKEAKDLDPQKEFKVVTEAAPVAEAEELPLPSIIVGHDTLLEKVWDHLMKNEVGIVGLYGMGGVGKTTLLKQINNKLARIVGRFNVVIWVEVSKDATIHSIQEFIAGKLEYRGNKWGEKSTSYRATDLHNILKTKNLCYCLIIFGNH